MSFKEIDHENETRPEGRACILVFGYDPIELNKIKAYATSINNLETIEVKADQTNNTLNQLIDGTGNVSSKVVPLNDPAIVLNAVSQAELNQFVHNFRTLNLKSPLFAMVTETSVNWQFHRLIGDLLEERAMFKQMKADREKK